MSSISSATTNQFVQVPTPPSTNSDATKSDAGSTPDLQTASANAAPTVKSQTPTAVPQTANSDGTVGPHHKHRHHGAAGSQTQNTADLISAVNIHV